MKKLLFLLLAALLPIHGFTQVTFVIDNFSDKYYGKLYIADTLDVYNSGWIAVYGIEDDKELIKVEADNLYYYLHDGEVKANIVEQPYGEQSVLIYDDFNFDGEKDFALSNGHNSCYGGPSFDIYLYDDGRFTYSEKFSDLSNLYCGMFEYNSSERRIYTMTKSGCCWHQYNEFTVENNEPKLIHSIEKGMSASGAFFDIVESTWNGTEMVADSKWIFNTAILEAGHTPWYSFSLPNDEMVILFHEIDQLLCFIRVGSGYEVIDYYHSGYSDSAVDFVVYEEDSENKRIVFYDRESDSSYTIYPDGEQLGFVIEHDQDVLRLKGDPISVKGNLQAVLNAEGVEIVK